MQEQKEITKDNLVESRMCKRCFPVVWALHQENVEELILCRAVQLVSLCRLKVEPPHMWLIMH